jgi:hypothetical protein
MPYSFKCSTTGKRWEAGFYIVREGEFHKVSRPYAYPGFRGIREFPEGAEL